MAEEAVTDSNLLAVERTHLAAERTFYAVLRTGLAIAGAGTVIVTVVREQWPEWLSLLLAGVFVVVGYTMIILMLNRYQKIMNSLQIEHDLETISPRVTIVLTVVLQITLAVVLGLVLLSIVRIPAQT